jgi:hypothetical protein
MFATLDRELAGSDDYGITLKLTNPEPWEQPYISIIDCRGKKRQRKYHTKWHELVVAGFESRWLESGIQRAPNPF